MVGLSVSGLVVGYGPADEILKGLDFAVDEGEIVAVIGPNGAGKSTLLKAIAGLLRPSQGSIMFDGAAIGGRPAREVCRLGLAYVPQENNIFPNMTVRENLEMGGFADRTNTRSRVEAIFGWFPMLAEKRRQPGRALSGGERQLLAMAMGLMVEPRILLLDEPSAGLSPVAAERLFEQIVTINREGLSVAMVEQNAREALDIASRAYILVDGRNSRSGPAGELAADPDIQRLFLGL